MRPRNHLLSTSSFFWGVRLTLFARSTKDDGKLRHHRSDFAERILDIWEPASGGPWGRNPSHVEAGKLGFVLQSHQSLVAPKIAS